MMQGQAIKSADPVRRAGLPSSAMTEAAVAATLAFVRGSKEEFTLHVGQFKPEDRKRISDAIGNYLKPTDLPALAQLPDDAVLGSSPVQKWFSGYVRSFLNTCS